MAGVEIDAFLGEKEGEGEEGASEGWDWKEMLKTYESLR